MSEKSNRNSVVSWSGILALAVVAVVYMGQSVQAGDLQDSREPTAVVASADSPWYQDLILGAQADFRDPLY